MPPRTSDRWPRTRHRNRRLWIPLLISALVVALASLESSAPVLRRANALGRRCSPDHVASPASSSGGDTIRPRIAIVSFSDDREVLAASRGGGRPRRSFRGVMETVEGNKRAYAAGMGYDFIDARGLVDRSRPPNWSKILAVRSHLPYYDWVFWNDADTVVMNPAVELENILIAVIGHSDFHASPDLVVTEDFNGVNSGVFFVRRSSWSESFLDTWWNLTSFIRFDSTKSGDNAAMEHLIGRLPPEESRVHVGVAPMQCLFNSYPWFPTWKSVYRLIFSPWTTWQGAYSDGDFMVHLAGLDDKRRWAAKFLQEMRTI
ncbi:probable alpha-1,6-mannosyltransferase MNN10 [Typha angustifolia]|uniref:probable alpha-1,6-mannosyltransferase MNN10 n=1 Tax=Typha angustifolia TaxID=59011 RepID=UPI003C2D1EE7